MQEVYEFLKKCGTYYLATVEGDQPRVRPFGTVDIFDGHLYIQTGKVKDVSKQIEANPKVEIAAFIPASRTWIRYTGTAVFTENQAVVDKVLEELPHLKAVYNEETGNKMMIFSLEDATALLIDMAGNIENIEL